LQQKKALLTHIQVLMMKKKMLVSIYFIPPTSLKAWMIYFTSGTMAEQYVQASSVSIRF